MIKLSNLRRLPRLAINIITKPAKRHDNPYATHLPVLVGLAHLLKVKSVLELGCGHYSTTTFLNCSAFPDLVKLRSFENDPVWIQEVCGITVDPRIKLTLVEQPMSSVTANIRLRDYDLIFVDDSLTAEERAQTIRQVAEHCTPSNVVAIHDYEIPAYREAARRFVNQFVFDAFNPFTGLVWDGNALNKRRLKELNTVIKLNAQEVRPDDLPRWVEVISTYQWRS